MLRKIIMHLNAKTRLEASSEPTPENVDTHYTVGGVGFDNRDGLGAVLDNANINYKGCVAFMRPTKFRQLALAADRTEDATNIAALIKDGATIGTPFLDLKVITNEANEIESVTVLQHEGRARTEAFLKLAGDVNMPVHLFFRGEYDRAKYITKDLLEFIDDNGIVPQGQTRSVYCAIQKFYLLGQTYKF